MAFAVGSHRATRHSRWPSHLLGLVAGFAAGLALSALLTMYVWPALLPYPEVVIPERVGKAAALVMGLICALAADVMVTARGSSRRRI